MRPVSKLMFAIELSYLGKDGRMKRRRKTDNVKQGRSQGKSEGQLAWVVAADSDDKPHVVIKARSEVRGRQFVPSSARRRCSHTIIIIHSRFGLCPNSISSINIFFKFMSDPSSCIFSLLPPPRDGAVTSRQIRIHLPPSCHLNQTNRLTSSLQYYLLHFQ